MEGALGGKDGLVFASDRELYAIAQGIMRIDSTPPSGHSVSHATP